VGRAAVPPATIPIPPPHRPDDQPSRAPVPDRPRRRRGWLLAALAGLLVVALAAAGVVVVRPGPVAGWLGAAPAAPTAAPPPPEPRPSPVLRAVGEPPAPTAAGVRAAIHRLVAGAGLGGRLSVSVNDVASGAPLYERGPDVLTVPASTTKLVTAVTALTARGPVHRIVTRAVAGARPGEVVLIGGGDPTLAVAGAGTYPGAARLDRLAAQVRDALGGVAPRRVTVDSSLFPGPVFGPGWDTDIPTSGYAGPMTALMTDGGRVKPKVLSPSRRHPSPDLAAGRAFAKALGVPAGAVGRGRAPQGPPASASSPAGASPVGGPATGAPATGTAVAQAPEPGAELGRVESPPLLRLVEFMLVESDNVVAEALARQVALARERPASYAGAAAAMEDVLTDLGLPARESDLVDGSGLSRRDRLTPSMLTDLLVLAAGGERPELGGILSGLPVAGWSGTLADRFRAPAGTGRAGVGIVRAKTGTLSGVHAMSGVVITAEGRALAFALLADGVTVGQPEAQAGLDAIAAALARCRCR
jgi:D-alanyl-D-alanine carboxypeptidase/D-alanyl-D-alanine-endopeptidase (penicillin-binding protein 4)